MTTITTLVGNAAKKLMASVRSNFRRPQQTIRRRGLLTLVPLEGRDVPAYLALGASLGQVTLGSDVANYRTQTGATFASANGQFVTQGELTVGATGAIAVGNNGSVDLFAGTTARVAGVSRATNGIAKVAVELNPFALSATATFGVLTTQNGAVSRTDLENALIAGSPEFIGSGALTPYTVADDSRIFFVTDGNDPATSPLNVGGGTPVRVFQSQDGRYLITRNYLGNNNPLNTFSVLGFSGVQVTSQATLANAPGTNVYGVYSGFGTVVTQLHSTDPALSTTGYFAALNDATTGGVIQVVAGDAQSFGANLVYVEEITTTGNRERKLYAVVKNSAGQQRLVQVPISVIADQLPAGTSSFHLDSIQAVGGYLLASGQTDPGQASFSTFAVTVDLRAIKLFTDSGGFFWNPDGSLDATTPVPPTIPPVVPPTVPPVIPPTVPPTIPPTIPPTVPPTVPPTIPPVVPPTVPPTIPPVVPPTTPPTTPPTVPPVTGDQAQPYAYISGPGQITIVIGTQTRVINAPVSGAIQVAMGDVNCEGESKGVFDLVVAQGATDVGPNYVWVYSGPAYTLTSSFAPYEASYHGGLNLAVADITGDGCAEIVTSADFTGGPRATGFSLHQNIFAPAKVFDFFAIDDPAFRGGVRIATADMNADGRPDLLAAAGFGGGPRVAAYSGVSLAAGSPQRLFPDFFAFESTLRNGVYIAGGDLTGDRFAELIAGGGPGGGPRVVAFDGRALIQGGVPVMVVNTFVGDPNFRDGVKVSTVQSSQGEGTVGPDLVTITLGQTQSQQQLFVGSSLVNNPTPRAVVQLPVPGVRVLNGDYELLGVFVG